MKARHEGISMRAAILSLLIAAIALPLEVESADNLPEGWHTDWESAQKAAAESNKPVLAVFSAVWCGPCQYMVNEVYPQPEVVTALEKWVPLYLEETEESDAPHFEKFKIEAFPTMVLLTPEMTEQERMIGGRDKIAFAKWLDTAPEFIKKREAVEAKLKANDKNPMAWKEKGDLLFSREDEEGAEEAYNKAESLDPENKSGAKEPASYFRALKLRDEDMELAAKALEAFETEYPKSDLMDDARFNRALLTAQMGEYDAAREMLIKASAEFPDSSLAGEFKRLQSEIDRITALESDPE